MLPFQQQRVGHIRKIVAVFGGFCYASGNEGSCSVNLYI